MERRLAAILTADVVGYSRLMSMDEAGTLAELKAHQAQFMDPTIAEYHGRIVKLMGDGVLVEFGSVIGAVECAVALQRGMAARNSDVPEGKRIQFRVGVNLGDVIIDGEDIHGDGVNVAARLEGLAEAPTSASPPAPAATKRSWSGRVSPIHFGRRQSKREFIRGHPEKSP